LQAFENVNQSLKLGYKLALRWRMILESNFFAYLLPIAGGDKKPKLHLLQVFCAYLRVLIATTTKAAALTPATIAAATSGRHHGESWL